MPEEKNFFTGLFDFSFSHLLLRRLVKLLYFIAILSGWYVTEVGRQPWIASGILRTADAASPVGFGAVLFGLVLFVLVYGVVFSMGIYYINRLIANGPRGSAVTPPSAGTPFSCSCA